MSATIERQSAALGAALPAIAPFAERRRTADRIFKGALIVNSVLTAFCALAYLTGIGSAFAGSFAIDATTIGSVVTGILIFNVAWGFIWYGVKSLLLKSAAGFSKDERRAAFSSRMSQPFEIAELLARHSERRIRIIDMIGRRGRFITLAAAFYGPQSRIMDGVLARANCLLILMLWTVFKFVLLPIGNQLATLYSPEQFVVVFALIWGSYIVTDALAELGGSMFGRQTIRVFGIGDINRKSVAGTLTGFVGALVFCVGLVVLHGLPPSWLALAVVIALSNSALELFSPRGTDDFTMATGNALICWAFGALVLA